MWSEDSSNAANAYDSAFLDCGVQATYSAWGAEMWEMPSWPERPTPIGEKVMEGFGKGLRKAVGEVPSKQEESCFHSTETSESWTVSSKRWRLGGNLRKDLEGQLDWEMELRTKMEFRKPIDIWACDHMRVS